MTLEDGVVDSRKGPGKKHSMRQLPSMLLSHDLQPFLIPPQDIRHAGKLGVGLGTHDMSAPTGEHKNKKIGNMH